MKVLVLGDSHTDIYTKLRSFCTNAAIIILRLPGATAQGRLNTTQIKKYKKIIFFYI